MALVYLKRPTANDIIFVPDQRPEQNEERICKDGKSQWISYRITKIFLVHV